MLPITEVHTPLWKHLVLPSVSALAGGTIAGLTDKKKKDRIKRILEGGALGFLSGMVGEGFRSGKIKPWDVGKGTLAFGTLGTMLGVGRGFINDKTPLDKEFYTQHVIPATGSGLIGGMLLGSLVHALGRRGALKNLVEISKQGLTPLDTGHLLDAVGKYKPVLTRTVKGTGIGSTVGAMLGYSTAKKDQDKFTRAGKGALTGALLGGVLSGVPAFISTSSERAGVKDFDKLQQQIRDQLTKGT